MENSPIIINRYRAATISLGYEGDSIINSIGDVISYLIGFWVAAKLSWKWSVAIFSVVELAMLWLIRDNLALNVLQLLWPIDAIRNWQAGG
jgi:MFS family permease